MSAACRDGNILAFDFGLRFIGVAVGQTLTGTARGLTTLAAKQGKPQWHQVRTLVDDYQPVCLVVGHPLHMDGERSDMSHLAEQFAARLQEKYKINVILQDERLTSFSAERELSNARASGHGGRGKTDHEVAACMIAEQYLTNS